MSYNASCDIYLYLSFFFQACNSKMQITDIVPRWSGNTHDAFIWKYSSLRELMRTEIPPNNFLLGDSGYPLEPWLLTPYVRPTSPSEEIFNRKHIQCRNVIERCFGLLKSRFKALHRTGGTLCYTPEKVCKIITACAVLHNICINYRLDEPVTISDNAEHDTDSDSGGDDDDDDDLQITLQAARQIRDRIAHQFQSQR